MKKLLLLIALFVSPLSAGPVSNEMNGMLYGWLGLQNSLSATNADLNAAFILNTSGPAFLVRFTSPVTQVSGSLNVYAYLATKTGAPTSVQMDVYPGPTGADDPQRPGSSGVLATAAGVDCSVGTPPFWSTFTVTGLSLVQGKTYWLVFTNTTATPASNFPSFRVRAQNLWLGSRVTGWTTINGLTTDPTQTTTTSDAPVVIKFNDGTIFGMPYVVGTAHASNKNDRGLRFRFGAPIKIAGFTASQNPGSATGLQVYQGSVMVATVTFDLSQLNNILSQVIYFPTVLTLSANIDYDFVFTGIPAVSTNFNRLDAGPSPPPDVTSSAFTNQSYVEGATPGSYTATAGSSGSLILVPDSLASGGTSMYISGN